MTTTRTLLPLISLAFVASACEPAVRCGPGTSLSNGVCSVTSTDGGAQTTDPGRDGGPDDGGTTDAGTTDAGATPEYDFVSVTLRLNDFVPVENGALQLPVGLPISLSLLGEDRFGIPRPVRGARYAVTPSDGTVQLTERDDRVVVRALKPGRVSISGSITTRFGMWSAQALVEVTAPVVPTLVAVLALDEPLVS